MNLPLVVLTMSLMFWVEVSKKCFKTLALLAMSIMSMFLGGVGPHQINIDIINSINITSNLSTF